MAKRHFGAPSLYGRHGGRKYLNGAERRRFLLAVSTVPSHVRLLCLVLFWSGSRVSEALALTANAIDVDDRVVVFETLKRRTKGISRQVPLPADLVRQLDQTFKLRARQRDEMLADKRLWVLSRTTAWRHVKHIMLLAGIFGPAAMPKGLRHAFGVAAFEKSVPLHLVQRWLGHASPRTTAIYGDVVGPDERRFAARIWYGAKFR